MDTQNVKKKYSTDELVRLMLPVLIRWAGSSWDKMHYYSDLAKVIGANTPRLGHQLGVLDKELLEGVRRKYNKDIPTLNALVSSMTTGLPSHGFDYIYDGYSTFPLEAKKGIIQKENERAHKYDWSWILEELGLKPAEIFTEREVETMRNKMNGFGCGEGEEHKRLKLYIKDHPEILGFKSVNRSVTEYTILSGDKLDVFFEMDDRFCAIEVKSHISCEDDITRGIFQCVKYKAVLEAERIVENSNKDVEAILVIEGELTEKQEQIVNDLGIDVRSNFKMKIEKYGEK